MNSNRTNEKKRAEMISQLLSSLGCSWTTKDGNLTPSRADSSMPPEKLAFPHNISYPSFSLSHGELDHGEDDNTTGDRRKAVQSKASSLMARKIVWERNDRSQHQQHQHQQHQHQHQQHPNLVMIESILDSFDQLVDARIRAYARILSNHVRVLSQSNNRKGAQIVEYKLQTLLEIAANHVLFDSISIEFKQATETTSTGKKENGHDASRDIQVNATEENRLTLPVDLTVEIQSPRLYQGNLKDDAEGFPRQSSPKGKLVFQAAGEIQADRILIGQQGKTTGEEDDTNSCSVHNRTMNNLGGRNATSRNNRNTGLSGTSLTSCENQTGLESVVLEIDCDVLLSQMMKEASKVVSMAVELTNQAWNNNTQKQQELNNLYDNDNDNMNISRNTANLIIADDDDDCNSSAAVQDNNSKGMTGKRSRCELCNDVHYNHHNHPADNEQHHSSGTHMFKQVSELSFHPPPVVVVGDEDHIARRQPEEPSSPIPSSVVAAPTTASTTITNLDMVNRDTNYLVSVDPSFESTSAYSEHDHDDQDHEDHEAFPTKTEREQNDQVEDEDHENRIIAERACHIVDFALAGDVNPACFSLSKRRRTK